MHQSIDWFGRAVNECNISGLETQCWKIEKSNTTKYPNAVFIKNNRWAVKLCEILKKIKMIFQSVINYFY